MLLFLKDILENDDIKLDEMFIASLVSDIVKVMWDMLGWEWAEGMVGVCSRNAVYGDVLL